MHDYQKGKSKKGLPFLMSELSFNKKALPNSFNLFNLHG
jgi:hypothetical protein